MVRLRDMLKYAMDGEQSRQYWEISFDPWPQRGLKWPDARTVPYLARMSPTALMRPTNTSGQPPLSTCDYSSCLSSS